MNTRSKSTLFLLEQLIVIAVFALCAAACISILTTSYFMARDSRDTAEALIVAQNCAEAFKVTGNRTLAGTEDRDFMLTVYYDKDWQNIRGADGAEFELTLSGYIANLDDGTVFYDGTVMVDRIAGENLVRLRVGAKQR